MADPDLRILARFLPEFERAEFSPGGWTLTQRQENGAHTMPYATLSISASDFVTAAYAGGWVLPEFDWTQWTGTAEAEMLCRAPELLDQATPRQLAQLLTVFICQDRFIEGGLLGNFESGHILAIVRRAAKLQAAGESRGEP